MATGIVTDRTEQLFGKALEHHRAGRLIEAQTLYREILAIDDRHAQALHHFGLVAHQVGAHARAGELIGRAIAIDEAVPEFHYNIALVFQALGNLEKCVAHNERAVALSPDWAGAHYNLGKVLAALGRLEAAVEQYRRAIALDPALNQIHFELGNALLALGQNREAAAAFKQSLQRQADYAPAHNNLGLALWRTGLVDQAQAHYRHALSRQPDMVEALNNLASALIGEGRGHEAIPLARESLRLREDDSAKMLFGQSIRAATSFPTDANFRSLIVRAVSEGWDRQTAFLPAIMAILKHQGRTGECIRRAAKAWPRLPSADELFGPAGVAPLADDELLSCLLQSGANIDIEIERFLTAARRALLEAATADSAADESSLSFYSRLAAQCFINEYVFAESDEEAAGAAELRNSVAAALEAGAPIAALRLVAVAAYMPLERLADAPLLLEREWPSPVTELLTQQVAEPAEERSYRSTIVRLTDIEDEVSAKVQRQYEENPYPRWVVATRFAAPVSVNAHLRRTLAGAKFPALPETDGAEILVAGCGTGRHAIETAQLIAGARVQAIDLSLDSLCYALRMTRKLGIGNVEYAQADLLEIGSLGRTFDVVESGGVLHHLADPFAGWRALLSVLRPGGFMFVALYSQIGRGDISAGRAFVADRGYRSTAQDIRRCRQDILARADDPVLGKITRASDFFTMSECRDLLFHVQEHCLSLRQIKDFLAQEQLDFLGFAHGPEVRARYSRMFPDDPSQTDLDNWHRFETENPDTFLGMYEFWIQKPS